MKAPSPRWMVSGQAADCGMLSRLLLSWLMAFAVGAAPGAKTHVAGCSPDSSHFAAAAQGSNEGTHRGCTARGYDFTESDLVTWQMIDVETIAMGTNVYVGLAVTSHHDGVLSTATFDHVSIIAGPVGPG